MNSQLTARRRVAVAENYKTPPNQAESRSQQCRGTMLNICETVSDMLGLLRQLVALQFSTSLNVTPVMPGLQRCAKYINSASANT